MYLRRMARCIFFPGCRLYRNRLEEPTSFGGEDEKPIQSTVSYMVHPPCC